MRPSSNARGPALALKFDRIVEDKSELTSTAWSYALLMFRADQLENSVAYCISNATEGEMLQALKEAVSHLERRNARTGINRRPALCHFPRHHNLIRAIAFLGVAAVPDRRL